MNKAKMNALLSRMLLRFHVADAEVRMSSTPARRYSRDATCPVCSAAHKTGKEFCSSEHAREFRAERRHHLLPTKNGVKGKRALFYGALRSLDSACFSFPPGHKHRVLAEANNINDQMADRRPSGAPEGQPTAAQTIGRNYPTDLGA